MTLHVAHLVMACLCLFLVGSNAAFLIHLGNRLIPWFQFKIVAVTLLLIYVTMSAMWGDPTWSRVVVGIIAALIDVWAIFRMWRSINEMARQGIMGLVPVLRVKPPRE